MRLICTLAILLLASFAAYADAPDDPGVREALRDDIVHIAPDKPEIIRLVKDAASIVVGSPKYASVTMDNPRTLLIIPRAEGSTSLTVLNKDGEIIMERRLIIGGPKEKYVRIRRACTASMAGCRNSQTYYCPDGCSDISLDAAPATQPVPTGEQVIVPMDNPPPIPPIDASELEVPQ